MRNIRYYLPGSIIILLALLILAVPEILIAFIASIIIMLGIGALYLGHLIKKSATDFRGFDEGFHDPDFNSEWFSRSPRFRRWSRYF